jgi:hypothetical protein
MQRLPDQLKDLIIQAGHRIEDDLGQDVPVFTYTSTGYRCNCNEGLVELEEARLLLDKHHNECIFKYSYSVQRFE